ncbi:hypothetical protein TCDM_07479 [Trypanosoma cruzi Dm28c]|uniref:Uncharacterized protein n=2 Tax=Trypanosoma cruzi TaxID=5693 RepID=V5B9T4_TRYCR|nr:hypothetical protein TCDM_07479 [Trypanosoma cruzi Dm28c]PBJ80165.1 hypothetical protein BCY84_01858 [Trypanosoma cruzi cruzi]PWU89491.1 hypothetical protein C4B63_59g130 [Trypanosoma cruzi]
MPDAEMPETRGGLVLFPRCLARAFRCLRDVPIVHFVAVTKVNRRGKRQRRFLVITSMHLYSCVENGSIQRCVPTRSVAEVHAWNGELPQVGLRIPSEYDMLFFMDSAADVTGVVAALQSATRDGASGRGDGGALRLVEATEALSVAAYCLERPKGFERGMRGTFGWLIGSVGDVPAAGMDHDALRPFVSANAKGLFVNSSTAAAAAASSSPPSSLTAAGGTVPAAAEETCLPGASNGTRCLSKDYSDDEGADAVSFSVPPPHSPTIGSAEAGAEHRTKKKGTGEEKTAASVISRHDNNMGGAAAALAGGPALRDDRRQLVEEREQWCLLLAAERRDTYRLRQAISDLRGQVLALTSDNIKLRTELLNQRVTWHPKQSS